METMSDKLTDQNKIIADAIRTRLRVSHYKAEAADAGEIVSVSFLGMEGYVPSMTDTTQGIRLGPQRSAGHFCPAVAKAIAYYIENNWMSIDR